MKAVNLLPREARRGSGAFSEVGIATTAIFGALAVGLALVVTYVFLANGVTSRQDQLARTGRQSTATERQAVALKPYADIEQLRESLLERVRSLAGGRYDWPTMISRLARALPADTTLTSLDGTPSAGAGPSVSLVGCTPSHTAVAGVIDRLRSVAGVSAVSLKSSTVATETGGQSGASGACPRTEQFKLTIALDAPAQAVAAPGAATPAPATPTPTPTPTPAPATPQASTGTAAGGVS